MVPNQYVLTHVKGWGIRRNERTDGDHYPCATDAGPDVHARCRFPWKTLSGKGKQGGDKKCVTGPTPSSKLRICRDFDKSKGEKKKIKDRKGSVIIKAGKSTKKCYYKGGMVHQTYLGKF